MRVRLEFIERPDYTIVQVINAEQICGSFNIKHDELDLWHKVNQYIQKVQEQDAALVTRIN